MYFNYMHGLDQLATLYRSLSICGVLSVFVELYRHSKSKHYRNLTSFHHAKCLSTLCLALFQHIAHAWINELSFACLLSVRSLSGIT